MRIVGLGLSVDLCRANVAAEVCMAEFGRLNFPSSRRVVCYSPSTRC